MVEQVALISLIVRGLGDAIEDTPNKVMMLTVHELIATAIEKEDV
jgi:hypothetical protein